MSIVQVNPFGNQSYQNYDMFTKSKKDSSDAETEKPDISEVMKKYQEAHEITAQKLREDTDWRDMTDEEWDKILEGMDQYIDAFKERLKLQEELQEEAAKKAAAEADSAMKTTAASAAALNVAAGGSGDVVAGSGDERNEVSTGEEVKHEKNWTKLLQTDDQTILRVAKRAQEMESMAMSKYQEVMLTGETTSGVRESDGITEYASVSKSDEDKDVWTITAFTEQGIVSNKCKDGQIISHWELTSTKRQTALLGKGLREAGQTAANAFRIFADKPEVDYLQKEQKCTLTKAVLAPMKAVKKLFVSMELHLDASIDKLDNLAMNVQIDKEKCMKNTKSEEQKATDRAEAEPERAGAERVEAEIVYLPMVAEPQEYQYNADAFEARGVDEVKQEAAHKEVPKVREDKAR